MSASTVRLAPFTTERFLTEIWQQRPLLVRQAVPGFDGPLDGDGLAALAEDEDVESRLVCRTPGRNGAPDDWTVEDGPISRRRRRRLGGENWTLLVQSVDAWVPEVADLLARFRFLPNWRLDDIMVSYAVSGGGVGPHVDQYDVFLLQGRGRRRWRVGPVGADNGPPREHPRLSLLARMPVAEEHVLEPGDMLYLPPGVAHDGEALEPCLTYSIGFRAPSVAALVTALAHQAAQGLDDGALRYRDPSPPIQGNPGEISAKTLAEVRRLVRTALEDDNLIAEAFALEVTEPKVLEALDRPAEPLAAPQVRALLSGVQRLIRAPGARLAFVTTGRSIAFYANAVRYDCRGATAALARRLAGRPVLAARDLDDWRDDDEACALIADLLSDGVLRIG